MERCIKESPLALAIVSPQYFRSGNCEEEAIICEVLDMVERQRQLVPLKIEKVEMPTWQYGSAQKVRIGESHVFQCFR